ncbi:GspE/PulE family protein [Arcobacter sp. CECT 8985]|uniref:GspE/PulE family protein n=1 Tax=Arcobacter sp. CECT 8985 TaxID=1935424 RepID=UPI00100AAB86|nr:GspE/PulE family protein [Arcobacter sp. CECT 8985]RXJ86841.1 general secretion pathway protein GspE [Arcobacter sp. CECT 8985]
MQLEQIHNTDLEVIENKEYENAFKNHALFTKYKNKEVIALNKQYFDISFDYLSKFHLNYEIIYLDNVSYETLYNKFLEHRTDKEMTKVQQEQENSSFIDEEFNVSEFLKVGSDILTTQDSAPIIKFVNSLFYQAIKKNASDIHIEMHEYKAEVRYRIDGVLTKHLELDKNIMALVISRIKVISNLDISEKRVPQDGRTQIKLAKENLDIRVSILPTFYGERVVMRILMQSENIVALKDLGFNAELTNNLENLARNAYGMILVTGPTGSGKSTTLHSLLRQIVSNEKNIITIEDPVEYKSNDISQIQVNSKVGLTFETGLRSILRQDPDIIMLGEIRDSASAKMSIQAALTGHLLFSTLHTNRAPAAITRLIDMGVEKFLISSSLLAVLAQRLVRKLCTCKEIDTSLQSYKAFDINKNTTIYKAVGCNNCNHTGYQGRVAIAELFTLNDDIKEYLKSDVDDNILMQKAIENNMIPLDKQLKDMITEGKTSVAEAIRIGIK